MTQETPEAVPGMKVVRGTPDETELVALVAGMVAMNAAAEEDDDPAAPTSAWMDRSRSMRGHRQGVLGRGPNAWRHALR